MKKKLFLSLALLMLFLSSFGELKAQQNTVTASNSLLLSKSLVIDATPSSIIQGQNIKVTTTVRTQNIRTKFTGEYAIALLTENNTIVATQGNVQVSKITSRAVSSTIRIPYSLKQGNYKLKVVARESGTLEWSAADKYAGTAFIDEINIVVSTMPKEIGIIKNMTLSAKTNLIPGKTIKLTTSIVPLPKYGQYQGEYAVTLLDVNDNLVYRFPSVEGSVSGTKAITCDFILPTSIEGGKYKVKLSAKVEGDSVWRLVNKVLGTAYTDFVTITVKGLSKELAIGKSININGKTSAIVQGQILKLTTTLRTPVTTATFNGDYAVALLDSNGSVVSYINPTKVTFAGSKVVSTNVKIQSDLPSGNYTLCMASKLVGEETWILSNKLGGSNYIDRLPINVSVLPEEIAIVGNMALSAATNLFPAQTVKLTTTVSPILKYGDYQGKYAIGIYTQSDQLVAQLEGQEVSLRSNTQVISEYFSIPADLPKSTTYKVRLLSKSNSESVWRQVGRFAGTSYKDVVNITTAAYTNTVDVSQNMTVSTSLNNLTAGQYITVKTSLRSNPTNATFVGEYGVALIDANDRIVDVLNNKGDKFLGTRLLTTTITLPNTLYAGNYTLKMAARGLAADATWTLVEKVKGTSYIDQISFTVNATTRLLSTMKAEGVRIYPNPIENELTIDSVVEIKSVKLFNMNRQVVYTEKVNNNTKTLNNLSHLSSGTYILQLETEQGVTSHKINKK